MKIPNDYMELSYRMEIVEDKDEGGFVVSYPDLPGCIICGETRESAVVNALDAKSQKPFINKVFVRMFLRFRIMRYGTGYAIPHFLSRE